MDNLKHKSGGIKITAKLEYLITMLPTLLSKEEYIKFCQEVKQYFHKRQMISEAEAYGEAELEALLLISREANVLRARQIVLEAEKDLAYALKIEADKKKDFKIKSLRAARTYYDYKIIEIVQEISSEAIEKKYKQLMNESLFQYLEKH